MRPLLSEAKAQPFICDLLLLAAEDELAHSEICLTLAERFSGRSLPDPGNEPVELPRFGSRDLRLEAALLVAGTCCINETLATVWIELCLQATNAPLSRTAHRAHLRDELDHARLGWAHLADVARDPNLGHAVRECVPALLESNLPLWLREDPASGISGHGTPSADALKQSIETAVEQIIIPGFRHIGL